MKSDATSSSLDRIVSLEIIPVMTQGSDHVANQDADNDEDQGQTMGNVQESIAVGRARRNPYKPSWLITNIIVAYILEEAIPSTYKETEMTMWKDSMLEEMSSLYKNDIWELSELPKGKKATDYKWIFAKKHGSLKGDNVRYKARLVAKGYLNDKA